MQYTKNKQLYIRQGNTPEIHDILIIGDEQWLGTRDNAYTYQKGMPQNVKFIKKIDPYTGARDLFYVHATPNIMLDTDKYQRDHDVHTFIKKYCTDLVEWDGEADKGLVRSREAFIIVGGPAKEVIQELYARIEDEIHGKRKTVKQAQMEELAKKSMKELLLLVPRVAASTFTLPFNKKTRKKMLKKIWSTK